MTTLRQEIEALHVLEEVNGGDWVRRDQVLAIIDAHQPNSYVPKPWHSYTQHTARLSANREWGLEDA